MDGDKDPREADIIRVDLDRLSGILGCGKDELLRSLRRERVSTTRGMALAEEEEDKQFTLDDASVLYSPPKVRQALVSAVTRHSPAEGSGDGEGPNQLWVLGGGKGKTLIDLVLGNLLRAGIERAVIVVGKHGKQIMRAIRGSPVRAKLEVAFVDLGEDYRESYAMSVVYARGAFTEPFLLMTAEHLFHPELIHKLADAGLDGGDAGCVLVEDDVDPEQLSFLPRTANFVHRSSGVGHDGELKDAGSTQLLDRVVAIGRRDQGLQSTWDGLDCGIMLLTPEVFRCLGRLARRKSSFTLYDALDRFAGEGRLKCVTTNGLPWLDLETKANRERDVADDLVERLTKEMGLLPWASRTVRAPSEAELDALSDIGQSSSSPPSPTKPPLSPPPPPSAADTPTTTASNGGGSATAAGLLPRDLPITPRRWRPHAERHVRTGSWPGPGDDGAAVTASNWSMVGMGVPVGRGDGASDRAGESREGNGVVEDALVAGWRLADEWREKRPRTRSLQSDAGGSGKADTSTKKRKGDREEDGGGRGLVAQLRAWRSGWGRNDYQPLGEAVGTRMGWEGMEPHRSLVLSMPAPGTEMVNKGIAYGGGVEEEQGLMESSGQPESRWNFVPVMAEVGEGGETGDGGEVSGVSIGMVRGRGHGQHVTVEQGIQSGFFYPVESQDLESGVGGPDMTAIIIPWQDMGDSRWADDEGYIVPVPGVNNQGQDLMFAVPEPISTEIRAGAVEEDDEQRRNLLGCLDSAGACMPDLHLPTEMPTDIRSVRVTTEVSEGFAPGEDTVAVTVVVDRKVPLLGWIIMFCALLGAAAMAPMGQLVQDLAEGMNPAFSPVWRWTCSALMYLPILVWKINGSKSVRTEMGDWRVMGPTLKAGIANAGWGLCFYSALKFASAAMVALFASLTPLALVIWRGITGEAVHPMEMFGVGLALTGGVVSTMGGQGGEDAGFDSGADDDQEGSSQLLGVMLATMTACWGGVYIVNAKVVRPNMDVILFGFLTTFTPGLFCALVMIVANGWSTEGRALLVGDIGLLGWLSSPDLMTAQFFTSLLSDVVGNLGFFLLLKYVSPLVISLVCLANPIVATIECLIAGIGDFPGPYFIVGGFLIVAGAGAVVGVSMRPRSEVFDATAAIKVAKGMDSSLSPVPEDTSLFHEVEFDSILDPTPLAAQEHHESAPLLGSAGRVYYGAPSV